MFDKVSTYENEISSIQDGSGSISATEIKNVLGVGKKEGSTQIWGDVIKEVDIDGDGEIQYEEFEQMMTKFLTKL